MVKSAHAQRCAAERPRRRFSKLPMTCLAGSTKIARFHRAGRATMDLSFAALQPNPGCGARKARLVLHPMRVMHGRAALEVSRSKNEKLLRRGDSLVNFVFLLSPLSLFSSAMTAQAKLERKQTVYAKVTKEHFDKWCAGQRVSEAQLSDVRLSDLRSWECGADMTEVPPSEANHCQAVRTVVSGAARRLSLLQMAGKECCLHSWYQKPTLTGLKVGACCPQCWAKQDVRDAATFTAGKLHEIRHALSPLFEGSKAPLCSPHAPSAAGARSVWTSWRRGRPSRGRRSRRRRRPARWQRRQSPPA